MRKKLKILLVLILILVLIVGGFALGVYLRLFDTKELNEEYKLHELPVVGEYFVPPAERSQRRYRRAARSPKRKSKSSRRNVRRRKRSASRNLHVSTMI